MPEKQPPKIVFGSMTLGRTGVEQARVHTLEESGAILDVFKKHGHTEVDTARVYGGGSSEEFLGQLDLPKRGLTVDTKVSPRPSPDGQSYTHEPASLRQALQDSLKALQTESVDIWYLHAPDHNVPYETTLREVDALYREGKFRRFGLSNYAAWEVAQITETARRNGWKTPDVFQGVYNAVHRLVEPELFPALRHYGIAFFAYNPLAGGILTDRYEKPATSLDDDSKKQIESGSRFDPNKKQGADYRRRYWNEETFASLDLIRTATKKAGIPTAEAALRWEAHHSLLDGSRGDSVIVGASSAAQLEQNLSSLEKGPLPQEVVDAFDAAWKLSKPIAYSYFR